MTQNVGDIEYVIKADTSQLLRADKEVNDATSGMESGFKRTDKAAEKTGKLLFVRQTMQVMRQRLSKGLVTRLRY